MIIDRDTSPETGVPDFILPTYAHTNANPRTVHVVNGEGEEEDKNY